MPALASSRLLAQGGGASLVPEATLSQQLLAGLLAWAGLMAVLHVGLSLARGRLPVTLFCLLGALAGVAAGLWALWDTLFENARRSLSAAVLWWPGFTLGLFVTGALGAAAWAGATLGLSRLLGGRPPPAAED